MIAAAREVGACVLVDGAQAVAHMPVDVQSLDCDFYVFSGHKIYGPTGIGVLYGKYAVLDSMVPRSEEHTSELQSRGHLVCRLLLENKNLQAREEAALGDERPVPNREH